MKQLILFVCIIIQTSFAFAQKEKKYIHQGNELYQQKKYKEAEASYRQSVEKSKASTQGNFNLGDALFKQKKFDNAAQKFTDIAASSDDKQVKAQAYHNLGNSMMESKKLEESIAAYKKSLMNNPKDDETRYNLAYAQEKLKQQQNKDKNKDNKDKNKKDQNKKDQDKDKKDQDNKDKKDQDKKDDKNQQDQKKDQDKKDEQNGQKPQPDKLSKEDAERMLEALKNEEKNTQDKLKNKQAKGVKGRIVKDW